MEIISGDILYRLRIKHQVDTKQKLLDFIKNKTTNYEEVNRIDRIDFSIPQSTYVQLPQARLDIKIEPTKITLLFTTLLPFSEWTKYTDKWFK